MTGTGFLIAPNLVATVAHVVEGDGSLRVTSPGAGITTAAQIIGFSHDDDLALLRTDTPLPGHIFRLAHADPAIGTAMAAIGFPLAQSMQLSPGYITGTHDHRQVGGEFDLSDVVLSNAPLNPGNSGGPWITMSGQVIALAESGPPYDSNLQQAQGNNGGVSAANAIPLFAQWRAAPQQGPQRGCQYKTSVQNAIETLDLYFYALDSSDYASAYAQLDTANHPLKNLSSFIDGVQSSTDTSPDGSRPFFAIRNAGTSNGQVWVDIAFRSHQHAAQGVNGETCTDWGHVRWSGV